MAEMYTEAFKELELLTEDTFNADDAGIKALSNFIKEQDLEDEPVEIIDVKAKSEFDLADSYVGKVIFKCPACHTLLYHDKEDIEFDEDKDKVNVAEECPYCGNNGGFYIVGEVAPYSEVEVKVDDDVVDDDVVDEPLKESLKRRKSKSMKEFLQTIDEFKTWKFKDKTEQGYEVKGLYKDLDDNRLHVIAFRPGRKDYLVGLGYNPDEGYWNQGRYDFQTLEDAVNSLKGDYKVEVFKKEVNESIKESVADIELRDEDYVFEEDTGNIHVAEDAIKYHPKYKKYINFRFVDDNDDKVLTYKLIGKTDEPKYPYEFEYVSEAKDFNESCGKKKNRRMTETKGSSKISTLFDKYNLNEDEIWDTAIDIAYDTLGYTKSFQEGWDTFLDKFSWIITPKNQEQVEVSKEDEKELYKFFKQAWLQADKEFGELYGDTVDTRDTSHKRPEKILSKQDPLLISNHGMLKDCYKEVEGSLQIPNTVTHIGERAFIDCKNLTNIIIPNTVVSILDYAFAACTGLSSVEIPDSVKHIGTGAFQNCSNLITVKIGNGVSYISDYAFTYCNSLKDIYYNDTKAQWNRIGKSDFWNLSSGNYIVHCTDGDIKKSENESLEEDLGSWLAARKYQKLDKKLADKKASGNLSNEEKKKLELKKKSALARARAGAKPEDPETGEYANKTQQILDKTKTTQNQRGGQASALKTLMDRVGVANKTELLAKLRKAGIRVTEAFNMDTKTLKEAFEKVELETATEKIKVSSEPKEEIKESEETIIPMTDESADEIINMNIEDIDEDELEELGEGFLKRVYENVDSFKINSKKLTENKIIAEGLIKFKSGKEKPTTFTFTPDRVTKSGKYKFLGENLSITKKKNAFTLTGKLNNNKFLSESLTYNYNQRNNKNEAKRIYGRVIKH